MPTFTLVRRRFTEFQSIFVQLKSGAPTKHLKMNWAMVCLILTMSWGGVARADWSIDFSRRSKAVRESDLQTAGVSRMPASDTSTSAFMRQGEEMAGKNGDESAAASKSIFDFLFDAGEPIQEIVILSTGKGFIPSQVRVRKNGRYKIHVVNVNENEKNVSFILDGFSEYHSTYYGKIKSFLLEPKKEGVFSFQSPETAAEGRLIVFDPGSLKRELSSVGSSSGGTP